jgi:AcrR family transcriptional regulator
MPTQAATAHQGSAVEPGREPKTPAVAEGAGHEILKRRVAIGTVFRHFPTKADLLAAIVKELVARLTDEVNALVTAGDPAEALFTFFTSLVDQAGAKKTVVDLLAEAGVELTVAKPVQAFRRAVEELLAGAQRAGVVRPDARPDEVMALLVATSQGALSGGWDADLRRRTLAIVFAGLRAPAVPPPGVRRDGCPD